MSVRRVRPRASPPRVAPLRRPRSAAGLAARPGDRVQAQDLRAPTNGLVTLTPDQAEEPDEEDITGPEFVSASKPALEELGGQPVDSRDVWQDTAIRASTTLRATCGTGR